MRYQFDIKMDRYEMMMIDDEVVVIVMMMRW